MGKGKYYSNKHNKNRNQRACEMESKVDTLYANLSGLKKTPNTRSQADQLKTKLKNLQKHIVLLTKKVNEKLGYDINVDYCANKNTKLKDIYINTNKYPQKFGIPLNPDIVEQFNNSKKYIIKQSKGIINGEKMKHHKIQNLCIALLPQGPMLFDYTIHFKHDYKKYSEDNMNISLYALLNGKDYMHLDRYDSLSLTGHTMVFDGKGNIVMKHVSASTNKKSHTHPYNQKYSILFSGKESVGHEDRVSAPTYTTLGDAEHAFEKKYNIHTLDMEIDEDLTLEEISNNIKYFEKSKNTATIKKEDQVNIQELNFGEENEKFIK